MSISRSLFCGFFLASVVLFPSAAFCVGADFEECARKQKERSSDPRGNFSQYSFKSVDEALKDPETFWKFITAPETPYIERRAAATQAMKALPFSEVPAKWIPRLYAAQDELEKAAQIYFGLVPPRCWSVAYFGGRGLEKERMVLGHSWTPPDAETPYPLTFDEELTAPWPWQVNEALKDLSSAIYKELDNPGRREELLSGVMALPITTDEEARLFVRISHYYSMHHKTLAVMARWHAIGADPGKPKAASMVAREVGNDMRMRAMYADPEESRRIGDVIIIDILKASKDREVVFNAANSYHDLHFVQEYEKREGKAVPASPTAIKLITEAVLDPQMGDDWSRVYYYSLFLPDLLADAPFTYAEIKEHVHETGDLTKDLQKIQAWYDAHEDELAKAALAEEPGLNKLRALLKE